MMNRTRSNARVDIAVHANFYIDEYVYVTAATCETMYRLYKGNGEEPKLYENYGFYVTIHPDGTRSSARTLFYMPSDSFRKWKKIKKNLATEKQNDTFESELARLTHMWVLTISTKRDQKVCAKCQLTNKEKYAIMYIENKKEVD